jgi:hypothetical protein
MDNQVEAENIKSAFEKIAPGRAYRVHKFQASQAELKKFQTPQK